MWIMVAHNLNTNKRRIWLEGDMSWVKEFNEAELLIGHNVLGFDFPMLKKVYDYDLPRSCVVHDTLIMSQVLNYRRFGSDGHSMEAWGKFLEQPKMQHEDWTQYSPEMKERCMSDVDLNIKMYDVLVDEMSRLLEKAPQMRSYMRAEHAVARWCGTANRVGWPFDVENAVLVKAALEEAMVEAHAKLESKLGFKTVAIDKKGEVVEFKKPRWTKQGFYDAFTARWFNVDPCSGFEGEERPIGGPYSRIEVRPLSLDSVADVKVFLFRNGWEPTAWNVKRDENGRKTKEKTTPKITEDSLEFLGGDGKLYTDFLTVKSRHGIVKTWLENVDEEGNLHGDSMTIGTPSMRMRHQIIVNVPTPDKPWGKELRSLFICKPGWKLVGCDSKGNQVRGLAHYLKDAHFIETLLHGDVHQYNADVLTGILAEMGMEHQVPRDRAKRVLYAYLFGAAGPTLWNYIFDYTKVKLGQRLKKEFTKAIPGFEELIERLENIYGKTSQFGYGYIPGIAGNRIYSDSFHKLLVYLLQAAEKATCACSLMMMVEGIEERNIPYVPLIFMHDELQVMVPEEYAEEVAAIGKRAFEEGPKLVGVEIMGGDAKIGNSWYETH